MKWIALIAAVTALPALALWLRGNSSITPKLFMLVGLMPFLMSARPKLYMALISGEGWSGHTHGIELAFVDLLLVAIWLSLPPARQPTPFRSLFLLYFIAVVISMFQASVPLAATFYAWQVARMYFVYCVVARACTDDRALDALLNGLTLGLVAQALIVLWQHYGLGIVQAEGAFAHQNTLGLVSHLIVMPQLALLLAGRRGWQQIATILAGVVIAILTASRAALGLSLLGFAIVYVMSCMRELTLRKTLLLPASICAVAALTPLAMSSLDQRFAAAPLDTSYDEREAFKRAAALMFFEHPMGIGANHYVYVSKTEGYSERAGVLRTSRESLVHNAYWLAAAETGWFGFLTFVMLLAVPLIAIFRAGWAYRGDPKGDLLIGLGVGLLVVYIHSLFEWILFSAQVQYLFVMVLGMAVGLAQQLGYWHQTGPAWQGLPDRRRTAVATAALLREAQPRTYGHSSAPP